MLKVMMRSLTIAEVWSISTIFQALTFVKLKKSIIFTPIPIFRHMSTVDDIANYFVSKQRVFNRFATHHAALDGKTVALFLHSWASICRRGEDSTLTPEETPFYDRSLIKDPGDHERTYVNFLLNLNGPNNKSLLIWDLKPPTDIMLGTFQLTRANIENIKKRVKTQWQEKQKQEPAIPVSSFTITSAYVWVCLVKAKKISTGKVHLGFSVDCRARLEPPLPSTYFGNCVTGRLVDADSNDLMGEDGVATAVKAICEAIEGLKDGAVQEVQLSKMLSIDRNRLFTIGGSPRFELYNTDFGWGRPRKVEMTSIDKSGAFSLSDCRYEPWI
ncbi:Phenolic glucoside malonyltransferase 1 [Camellia lanceoleosa]|uniref:Phenolic glucoside malonyltransferase 1 n=1 Tax=Camellia lanceoleosa TaxID=1840588 RepID=A0ACC0IZT0_9ERIC|nr:Phenolic glucoside malonyltransferase 1 [Camellia lanceoleosa]